MATNPFSTFRALFLLGFCLLGTIAVLTGPSDPQAPLDEVQANQKLQREIETLEKSAALEDMLFLEDASRLLASRG